MYQAITWEQLYTSADWNAFAGQYATFRVVAIKFDIVDTQPNAPAFAIWGTFSQGDDIVPSSQQVMDSADSVIIAPGTGRICLYWLGKGTLERGWYSTNNPSVNDFGGLQFYTAPAGGATTTSGKFRVVTHYLVDFRQRV